jgi:hypothetical protein
MLSLSRDEDGGKFVRGRRTREGPSCNTKVLVPEEWRVEEVTKKDRQTENEITIEHAERNGGMKIGIRTTGRENNEKRLTTTNGKQPPNQHHVGQDFERLS